MRKDKLGILYVVATPIGNLQDMTLRGIEILKTVDRIVAEDTRHARPLLQHFSIDKPIFSMHEFNERERMKVILEYVQEGAAVALISDAGTPLISDPGFNLIREARKQGITVVPIPGPSALIAALSVAGLPTDKFSFEGFLPAKSEARLHALQALIHETYTMIFYEAPHRLTSSLDAMADIFGLSRKAVVAREMTKIHESILDGSLAELIEYFANHPKEVRGEVVIIVEGVEKINQITREVRPEDVLNILLAELPLKQAVSLASKITGERKNILYDLALLKKN